MIFKKYQHIEKINPEYDTKEIKEIIIEDFLTEHTIEKVYQKIKNENESWNSKYISRLLNTVYYDLINEELRKIIKKYKNPKINFKRLNTFCNIKIKKIKNNLF